MACTATEPAMQLTSDTTRHCLQSSDLIGSPHDIQRWCLGTFGPCRQQCLQAYFRFQAWSNEHRLSSDVHFSDIACRFDIASVLPARHDDAYNVNARLELITILPPHSPAPKLRHCPAPARHEGVQTKARKHCAGSSNPKRFEGPYFQKPPIGHGQRFRGMQSCTCSDQLIPKVLSRVLAKRP
jgi:hypothetical protein